MNVKIKRAYEEPAPGDGFRVLVDRLWPRGLKKTAAAIDVWLKEVAPSTALRQWFNHDPERWQAFKEKYRSELEGSEALQSLKALIKEHKTVTLLFSAKDEEHNQAVALNTFLGRQRKAT
ncbi:DUF488 domain-containing protein [Taibaiella koreensis]|uniref:DUF488 domain-containing protein n=1 Tax=Taibaiella koreensis TaxID=1268548 RepID=UPI000E59D2DD|nr:DUF488 family protein [Taibaiella koreensis]